MGGDNYKKRDARLAFTCYHLRHSLRPSSYAAIQLESNKSDKHTGSEWRARVPQIIQRLPKYNADTCIIWTWSTYYIDWASFSNTHSRYDTDRINLSGNLHILALNGTNWEMIIWPIIACHHPVLTATTDARLPNGKGCCCQHHSFLLAVVFCEGCDFCNTNNDSNEGALLAAI